LISVAIVALLVAAPAAQAPSRGNSAATITGAFADSCRDFTAHSSKDISYIELHYATGLVVRNESINSHDRAIDGNAGDEIEVATVKSGTTIEEFGCVPSNRAPTALIEIKTPEDCHEFFSGGLECEQSSPRTAWTNASQIPDDGGTESGVMVWGCGFFTPRSQCSFTFGFRGIGSSDPNGDITSWSLDFGDGTSTSGSWGTAPPTEIAHEFAVGSCSTSFCVITLTVTDSAGQSHSDSIVMVFVDQTPD
jgi:PKD domain